MDRYFTVLILRRSYELCMQNGIELEAADMREFARGRNACLFYQFVKTHGLCFVKRS